MSNPEVRPPLAHRIAAYAHFMETIAELEEELETVSDTQAAERLEKTLANYKQTFDVLTHDNNVPLVARFLEDQAEELRKHTAGDKDAEKIQDLERLANGLSRAAKNGGDLAYRYFKTQLKLTYKADNSIVTNADVEVEKLIRKIIAKHFPDHGIIGEELENTNPKAKYQWVIDPIDGTKRFAIGHQYWSTLIAVLENDKPIIGISFFPATDEFFLAQKNKGALLNNHRLKISNI